MYARELPVPDGSQQVALHGLFITFFTPLVAIGTRTKVRAKERNTLVLTLLFSYGNNTIKQHTTGTHAIYFRCPVQE